MMLAFVIDTQTCFASLVYKIGDKLQVKSDRMENNMTPLTYEGYICDVDDPEIEEALSYLLAETVLITGFFSPPNPQLQFGVLCNDTFYRAADMELLTDSSEIFDVFHIYRKDGYDGLVEWIAKRRGIRPLKERNNTPQTHDDTQPKRATSLNS